MTCMTLGVMFVTLVFDDAHSSMAAFHQRGASVKITALVRSSVVLSCVYYVLSDWMTGQRIRLGLLGTKSGARHKALSIEESLAYIEQVHADYLRYAGLERFTGSVCEIGPGDNFGVALLLLKYGAAEVHAIDRYRPHRNTARQGLIYKTLAKRHGLDHLFDGEPGESTIRGLHYYPGQPAETFFGETPLRFDAIISRAVIEHLYDPLLALTHMYRVLRPGGLMVHRIDLRDHGMFAGHHPLTFLMIPKPIYRRMVMHSGRPNRLLLPAYRKWLAASGVPARIRITRLVGNDQELEPADWPDIDPELRRRAVQAVAAIRPALPPPFRNWPDPDLAISGFVLVAARPQSDS